MSKGYEKLILTLTVCCIQERQPNYFPDSALREAGLALCLGTTVELTLVTSEKVPEGMRANRGQVGFCPFLSEALDGPTGAGRRACHSDMDMEEADGLMTSDTSQTQIQGFELAHPNIYPVDELHEGASPTDLKLQDLHDTGQQQDIQEKFQ